MSAKRTCISLAIPGHIPCHNTLPPQTLNAAATHIQIGRRCYACSDLARASTVYQQKRDASGKGASQFPRGRVFKGDRLIALVSYNGRVWDADADNNSPLLMEAQ